MTRRIRTDRAFSPFTGVLLVLFTTFLLIGTVALFFGGLNPSADQTSAPSPDLSVDYAQNPEGNEALTISHSGGGQVNPEQMDIVVSGASCTGSGDPNDRYNAHADFGLASDNWFSAGMSLVVDQDNPRQMCSSGEIKFDDATVRVIWVNPGGSNVVLESWSAGGGN